VDYSSLRVSLVKTKEVQIVITYVSKQFVLIIAIVLAHSYTLRLRHREPSSYGKIMFISGRCYYNTTTT